MKYILSSGHLCNCRLRKTGYFHNTNTQSMSKLVSQEQSRKTSVIKVLVLQIEVSACVILWLEPDWCVQLDPRAVCCFEFKQCASLGRNLVTCRNAGRESRKSKFIFNFQVAVTIQYMYQFELIASSRTMRLSQHRGKSVQCNVCDKGSFNNRVMDAEFPFLQSWPKMGFSGGSRIFRRRGGLR